MTSDNIRAHRPILEYIKAHIPDDWNETLIGNRVTVVKKLQEAPWA